MQAEATPSTSSADLRPKPRRSYSTAATLPYTKVMFAYSFFQTLDEFHVIFPCKEITQAEPCKRSKRTEQLQQCQFSATALNSIKVTAQLHSRVKTTSGLNPFTTDELVEDTSKTC